MSRLGDWIQTYTGRQFWPLDPRPEDVCIEDIAHALSLQCRFAGHCKRFYSVAEHSVRVSWVVPEEHALIGLLHDASEAYLQDFVRPLKNTEFGRAYRLAEYRVQLAICEHFRIPVVWPTCIGEADNRMLATEMCALTRTPLAPLGSRYAQPFKAYEAPGDGLGWDAPHAELDFLRQFELLTRS